VNRRSGWETQVRDLPGASYAKLSKFLLITFLQKNWGRISRANRLQAGEFFDGVGGAEGAVRFFRISGRGRAIRRGRDGARGRRRSSWEEHQDDLEGGSLAQIADFGETGGVPDVVSSGGASEIGEVQ
jgi:hypothetical protein